jgi:hypothetical protein
MVHYRMMMELDCFEFYKSPTFFLETADSAPQKRRRYAVAAETHIETISW